MAKIAYSKLKLTKKDDIKTFEFGENTIEVKQYLPVLDKLNIVANVLNASLDDNDYANPLKIEVFGNLEIVYNYTNLTFTDKQKEDPAKLYDILETNGIINSVISLIPEAEYTNLLSSIDETLESYYKYKNSAKGIIETISTDYSNLDFDAQAIQDKIADPNNLELLKNIIEKLG